MKQNNNGLNLKLKWEEWKGQKHEKYHLETQKGGGMKEFLQEDKMSASGCTVRGPSQKKCTERSTYRIEHQMCRKVL